MVTQKRQELFFFVKTCIFIVIFLALFIMMNRVFLAKNENMYNYINFSGQPENFIDILVLGSSHSLDGIDAQSLDKLLVERYGIKTKTFNMSITGMRLEQMGYRWKEALKTQRPSLLILETFSCSLQSAGTDENINRWALDYMPLSKEKMAYIGDEIEANLQTSFLVPFIKYHSRWRELNKEDWEILSKEKTWNKSLNQGFTAPNKPEFEGEWDDYFEQDFSEIKEVTVMSEDYQDIVEEIIQTCREIDCQVLFLCIPYKVQADVNAIELVKYNNYLEETYVNNEDVHMYDMQKMTKLLNWGYEYMTDEGHVNNHGREVVNEKLAEKISNIWRR